MPRQIDWIVRIKKVNDKYRAVQFAADLLIGLVRKDPSLLPKEVRPQTLVDAAQELDATFLTRIFAEFETGLRQYWETISESHPKTRDLLDSLAARRPIAEKIW